MKRILFFLGACLFISSLHSQKTFPSNEVRHTPQNYYAFTNATIHLPTGNIENGSLIIKEGRVVAVGQNLAAPDDAVLINLQGKHIYPSFIDLYSDYGLQVDKVSGGSFFGSYKGSTASEQPVAWNDALIPQFRAHYHLKHDKRAENLRKNGFGAVVSHRFDGIARGSGVATTLGDEALHSEIIKPLTGNFFSFEKGSAKTSYPTSLMGCIALLRQTHLDAEWYERHGHKEEKNISLEAWNELDNEVHIYKAQNQLDVLRIAALAKEFNKQAIVKGAGDSYMRLNEIKQTNVKLIVPLTFPEAYDVENPYDALTVSLSDMKHWELAPQNPAILQKAGISIALTADGLKSPDNFLPALKKAISHGLSEPSALKALTTTPAKWLGIDDMVGTLEKGKIANFFITDENIFKTGKILQNWVRGNPYLLEKPTVELAKGTYQLTVGNEQFTLVNEKKTFIERPDSNHWDVHISSDNDILNLSFATDSAATKWYRLSGTKSADMAKGNGQDLSGNWVAWQLNLTKKWDKEASKQLPKPAIAEAVIPYPFVGYGWTEAPKQEVFFIENATVWTNSSDGILTKANVLIQDGKIKAVGKDLKKPTRSISIDGSGMHVTPGIVDEHSHIGIFRGVNECSQSSTAEVRVSDVVNSEDINIYRQLSGGVTAAQLLHGSCNPIGGQSALIKLRWGASPQEMLIKNTDGFIKFALGENVKRSSWHNNNRFPNSRVGVEQVYVDNFSRAKEYLERRKSNDPTLRRDLDLESVGEILDKKRFISCHSYVQSEINMLMKVAEKMGFRVNTFTHILEGYKVADKMAAHGAGGSSFADWWAYKFEVYEAIPYNAAMMHNNGVLTAINSDDAEMARRLNQEAAKTVLFGDVSEEDALKMVTLNPAKLLHIDNRTGSIEVGKDADVVLWNEHPLSMYARAEKTFVDGKLLFDRSKESEKQTAIQAERQRLITKMLAEKLNGGKTQPVKPSVHKHYHCDTDEDEMR